MVNFSGHLNVRSNADTGSKNSTIIGHYGSGWVPDDDDGPVPTNHSVSKVSRNKKTAENPRGIARTPNYIF